MKIELGSKVRDQITGLTGTATGRTEYITGCEQILVQPPLNKDGAFVQGHWVDVDRLVVVDEPKLVLKVEKNGPDMAAPIK